MIATARLEPWPSAFSWLCDGLLDFELGKGMGDFDAGSG